MRENGKISEFPLFAFNFWYNKCQLIHASWDNFPSRPLSYRVSQIWEEYMYFALTRRLCPAFDQMLKGGSAGPMTRVLLAPRSACVGAGIPAGGFEFCSRNAPSSICEEDATEIWAEGVAAGGVGVGGDGRGVGELAERRWPGQLSRERAPRAVSEKPKGRLGQLRRGSRGDKT